MTAFETKPCDRCGGTGSYSFNAIDGSRCYGCGGSGKVLTARGKKAQKMFRDAISVPLASLQPGWLVFWKDINLMSKKGWVRLADVRRDGGWLVLTTQGGMIMNVGISDEGAAELMVRGVESMAQRDAAVAEALAYQSTLPA